MEVVKCIQADGETKTTKTELSLEDIRAFDTVTVSDESSKMNRHIGFSVVNLVGDLTRCSGVFTASDGVSSEPIVHDELIQGLILHSDPDGEPLQRGGPLRVWFPVDVAIQASPCGKASKSLELKFLRSLTITSL